MSAQERFNQVTGRKEFYIEVEGIPGGYWTPLGLCDRCYSFNKCLGLARLSKEEWEVYENSPTKLLANLDLKRIASCENNF
jgi:hypothetical protein